MLWRRAQKCAALNSLPNLELPSPVSQPANCPPQDDEDWTGPEWLMISTFRSPYRDELRGNCGEAFDSRPERFLTE
jgi:hypothetical protein